ncbi:MAG: hypothetical protein JWO05_876 [Gemmatimonadetes bacterium]|nr:hypothetical protein [Gemmatimonadota bacterium]
MLARNCLGLALLGAALACGASATTAATVPTTLSAGEYTLTTINGKALPLVVESTSDASGKVVSSRTITGGSLTLAPGGQSTRVTANTYFSSVLPSNGSSDNVEHGNWSETLIVEPSGTTKVTFVSSSTIALSGYAYTRK